MKDWDWQRIESLCDGIDRNVKCFREEWEKGSGVQHDTRHMLSLLDAGERDLKAIKALLVRERASKA